MRREATPSPWPYAHLILIWAVGSLWLAAGLIEHAETLPPGFWASAGGIVLLLLVGVAQSVALFYLLGFLAKSVGYLLPFRGQTDSERKSATEPPRSLAVLYLTAGDFDAEAVSSLLEIQTRGPGLFVVHDDGDDETERRRIEEFLRRHPRSGEWEIRVWHRPRRTGGKAGAVNWVLERLDPTWDLLLLCDSDSLARDPGSVARIEHEFGDPSVAVVQCRNSGHAGPEDPPFLSRLAEAIDVFDVFAATQARWGYLPFFGHNAILRISDLRRAGGLTPGFFSDDLDLSVRLTLAGRRIVYRRDVAFGERHPPDLVAFRKRARKWAFGCMQVVRRRALPVLTAKRLPFAHRIGLLEFMGFYPAQALLLCGLLAVHLVFPWIWPDQAPDGILLAGGSVVLVGLLAPTLAWAVRHGALRRWPALAWSCVLVYGGSLLASARGVLDGLSGRERPWIPTNLTSRSSAVPPGSWAESALGLGLLAVPWMHASDVLAFPATYLFVSPFLFAPLTYAFYRAERSTEAAPRVDRARAAGWASLLLVLLAPALHAATGPVEAQGERLLLDGRPLEIRGIHYSPWLPQTGPADPSGYPDTETVEEDLDRIASLGANTILVHDAPRRVLAQARERELLTVYAFSIGWSDTSRAHFLSEAERIVAAVDTLRDEEGILMWLLGNEVPVWVVELLGAETVESRLRLLADRVRERDPDRLLGHANWPPTKHLELDFLDVACFNVYPAWPYEVSVRGFGPYIQEVLEPLAGDRPLLITEFGINSLEAGEERQARVIAESWREIDASRAVGGIVFGWADEWWKNYDNPIPGKGFWERAYDPHDAERHDLDPEEHYGIVRSDRSAKPALEAVRRMWSGREGAPGSVPWLVVGALGVASWLVLGWRGRRNPKARTK